MKMYTIKKGTQGILLKVDSEGLVIEREWTVTKDVELFETIMDPVRWQNTGRPMKTSSQRWASEGKATFRDGNYALVVPYNQVEIM